MVGCSLICLLNDHNVNILQKPKTSFHEIIIIKKSNALFVLFLFVFIVPRDCKSKV